MFQRFMERNGSLPSSQELSNGLYPEPDESTHTTPSYPRSI
jgi:hypothetical protein